MEDARLVWEHGAMLRALTLAAALLLIAAVMVGAWRLWLYGVRNGLILREPGDVEEGLRREDD